MITTDTGRHEDPGNPSLPGKVAGYTAAELALIQDSIAGKFIISREQFVAALPDLKESFPQARDLPELLPLYFQDRETYQKAYWDPHLEDFHIYHFFPQVIAVGLDGLELSNLGRNRCAIKFSKDGESFFIKSIQTESECEIAETAAKLGVGPAQLPSLDGYVTEVQASGYLFNRMPEEMKSPENMRKIGKNLGVALKTLHEAGIAFNDTILLDDFGHSHLVVNLDCSVTLIDYGNALKLCEAESASPEFIRNYCRSRFGCSELRSTELKHFTDYDCELVRQGLYFAGSSGMSNESLKFLSQGFEEGYCA